MATEPVILITGVSGYLGNHLRMSLARVWPTVRVVGLARTVAAADLPIDLLDRNALSQALLTLQPDFVFHLAGTLRAATWLDFFRGNVETTINLLQLLCTLPRIPRVVIAGSAAEYGPVPSTSLPIAEDQVGAGAVSQYGIAKAWQTSASRFFAAAGLPLVTARIFNIVGPGLPETTAPGTFAAQLKRIRTGQAPPRLNVGHLESRRDYLDVSDVCDALIALAQGGHSGEVYNICSGVPTKIRDLLDQMVAASGVAVEINTDATRLQLGDISDSYGSCAKISARTGWRPRIALATSVSAMLE